MVESEPSPQGTTDARTWLINHFIENGITLSRDHVLKAAANAGYPDSTIRRAFAGLKAEGRAVSRRIGFGKDQYAAWSFPVSTPIHGRTRYAGRIQNWTDSHEQ